jgi:hypothetical protein
MGTWVKPAMGTGAGLEHDTHGFTHALSYLGLTYNTTMHISVHCNSVRDWDTLQERHIRHLSNILPFIKFALILLFSLFCVCYLL